MDRLRVLLIMWLDRGRRMRGLGNFLHVSIAYLMATQYLSSIVHAQDIFELSEVWNMALMGTSITKINISQLCW